MPAWRDIQRSAPVVITPPDGAGGEIDLDNLKEHLKYVNDTASDTWLQRLAIPAARELVERDSGLGLGRTIWEMRFDAFPWERWIPLPNPPLVSVSALAWTDDAGVETTVASSEYIVDTHSAPGRLILAPSASWPSGLRSIHGGRVRWTSGFQVLPTTLTLAMALLIDAWDSNRGLTGSVPEPIECAYDSLISDRMRSFG